MVLKKAVQQAAASEEAEAYASGTLSLSSDARTMLAGFFSILLGRTITRDRLYARMSTRRRMPRRHTVRQGFLQLGSSVC